MNKALLAALASDSLVGLGEQCECPRSTYGPSYGRQAEINRPTGPASVSSYGGIHPPAVLAAHSTVSRPWPARTPDQGLIPTARGLMMIENRDDGSYPLWRAPGFRYGVFR